MRRVGEVMRILPHGTIMVWDTETKRSFPCYRHPPHRRPDVGDTVSFDLDDTQSIAVDLRRLDESK